MRFRKRGILAVGLGLSILAAACGDDSDDTSSPATSGGSGSTAPAGPTTTAAPRDIDPNGILKLSQDLTTNGGPNTDPTKPTPPSPNTAIVIMLYDTLLRVDKDGKAGPGLAKTATIVDPSTLKIELFPNIKFTDGTPLDAEAAKFGIERNRDSTSTTMSAERKEISEIVVDSPTTFTMKLKTPIAGSMYDLLHHGDFLLVSPTAVRAGKDMAKEPVGAGPFKLQSISPGQSWKYVKNPDYFQADRIRYAGVEWVNITAGSAVALPNALRAGQIDVAEGISYTQSQGLGGGPLTVETEPSDNIMLWGATCKNRPPFDNVKVRQALNLGIDRTALNNLVYQGKGEPMAGFFGSKSPLYSKAAADLLRFDPARARQLLAEAGQSSLTFDMFFTPGVSDVAAEAVQRMWKDIGVTVNIKPLTSAADFFPDAKAAPMNFFPLERAGVQKVVRNLQPPSVGNVCGWNDATLNDLVAKIKAVAPDSREAVQHWDSLQKLVIEQAMNVYGLFGVRAWAYNNSRVGNFTMLQNFQGRPTVNFYDVYIKK